MAVITKRELAISISKNLAAKGIKITKQVISKIVQALIDEITETLAAGDNVEVRGFGVFEVCEMKAKLGRNPRNPTSTFKIPARATVKFKPVKELKGKVAATLKIVRERKK